MPRTQTRRAAAAPHGKPAAARNAAKASPKKKQKAAADIVIPDKLYFRIGEVAKLLDLETYVLRFWETEFPQLKPQKSDTGQRVYRRKNVESILRIRTLLYDEGFTIAGARQALRAESRNNRAQTALPFSGPNGVPREKIRRVQQGLREVLAILGKR